MVSYIKALFVYPVSTCFFSYFNFQRDVIGEGELQDIKALDKEYEAQRKGTRMCHAFVMHP